MIARILALAIPAALLAAQPSPAQAAEDCQGQVPTHVGVPGEPLTGTDGPDVIVTNGAATVDAGAGDDRVCVTGAQRSSDGTVRLAAGPGADAVTGNPTAGSAHVLDVDLGAGPDTVDQLELGDLALVVATGDAADGAAGQPASHDVVVLSGRDFARVSTGVPGDLNTDVVETTGVETSVRLDGDPAGRLVSSPPSRASALVIARPDPHRWHFDVAEGTATFDGRPFTARGFRAFDLEELAWSRLRFDGSALHESLSLEAPRPTAGGPALARGPITIATGARDDSVHLGVREARNLRGLRAGAGRDSVRVGDNRPGARQAPTRFAGDLRTGRLVVDGRRLGPVRSVEDLSACCFTQTTMVGTAGRNTLESGSCGGRMSGGGGEDRLIHRPHPTDPGGCGRRWQGALVRGGGGDDEMHGTPYADRLYGGAGRDVARAGRGRDVCVAERRSDCESSRRGRADHGAGRTSGVLKRQANQPDGVSSLPIRGTYWSK